MLVKALTLIRHLVYVHSQLMGHVANDGEYDKTSKDTREAIAHGNDVRIPVKTKNNIWKFSFMKEDEIVVVVRLEHSQFQ